MSRQVTSHLSSPLPGVGDDAWARFVTALEVQPVKAMSESGGFGAYDLRPRRLQELGLVTVTKLTRGPSGRSMCECNFVAPMTRDRFLSDPLTQYRALVKSMTDYHRELTDGSKTKPADISMAGALAVLHRGMHGALRSWPNLFDNTRALYEAAQGAF